MCIEREKDNFKSREVNCLKECALALRHSCVILVNSIAVPVCYYFLLVTAELSSQILRSLSGRASDVKQQGYAKELEEHAK